MENICQNIILPRSKLDQEENLLPFQSSLFPFNMSIVIIFLSVTSATTVCTTSPLFSHTQLQRIILLPLMGLRWEGLHRRTPALHLHDTTFLPLLEAGFKNQSCDLRELSDRTKHRKNEKQGVGLSYNAPPFPSSHQRSTLCSALLYIHRQQSVFSVILQCFFSKVMLVVFLPLHFCLLRFSCLRLQYPRNPTNKCVKSAINSQQMSLQVQLSAVNTQTKCKGKQTLAQHCAADNLDCFVLTVPLQMSNKCNVKMCGGKKS